MVVLGRITAPFGVLGWVKVQIFGDDPLDWANLPGWWLGAEENAKDSDWQARTLSGCKSHGKGLVARFEGVDDRSDPVLSAQAAARMLKYDYDIVGTWPLAINSYNAGRRHLERAIAALGTRDIVKIIRRYRVGSYGFASRNYYPEFLAACRVYDNRAQYFPALKHPQKNWQSK